MLWSFILPGVLLCNQDIFNCGQVVLRSILCFFYSMYNNQSVVFFSFKLYIIETTSGRTMHPPLPVQFIWMLKYSILFSAL